MSGSWGLTGNEPSRQRIRFYLFVTGTVKLNREKNMAQRAWRGLSLLAVRMYSRFLWSRPEKARRQPPANVATPPGLVSQTAIPYCRHHSSAWRFEKKAQGWTLLSLAERWEGTAPTPTSEASTSTMNCLLGSGWIKMRAEVNR